MVSVTLLGGFSAVVDGVPVPETAWRLKKARELVKLLALAPGHRVHREQAMDALWRDRPVAAAANNLHQAVHVARRALEPDAIEVREEMLRLVADVDVDELERAVAEARRSGTPPAYRAALSLYAGELLPENRYDDWVADRREELAELAAELADRAGAVHDRPIRLPMDPSSFVGRDRELAGLTALLRRTRLLTLAGPGGVGKTRLALEVARAAGQSQPDGVVLVELAALADGDFVPDVVAGALDVRPLSGQSVVDAVIEFLAGRSMLLVVDNCEHLLAATARLIDTILRFAPVARILATSREPLRVASELVFRVPSLELPRSDLVPEPGELLGNEAVRLFVERAAAAAPGFVLTEDNAADVARICLRLDGLPLALELAAGRVGALGPAAIAERLEGRFRVLRAGGDASPARQQTLAATLQWSYDLLLADERTLFRRLGVFAGGFGLDAVEKVCADGELDAGGVADVLARLVEKSLVLADEGSSRERRYRLLETVRFYARERLEEAGETSVLRERHARWALALAEAHRGAPGLDPDAANLRAAHAALLEQAPRDALRLCVALSRFWLRRIDLHEAQRAFDEALAAAGERTALRATALLSAAAIDFRSGDIARALGHAEESYAVASEIGDLEAEWRALQFLGECGITRDASDLAMPWFERALELARRNGSAAAEGICVYSLGVSHWIRGDLARADELVSDSIDLFRSLAGSPQRTTSPVNVAEIRTRQPTGLDGLRIEFQDTLQPFIELSCEGAVSYLLTNQAGIARARGDPARARRLLDESAAQCEASGDELGKAAVLVRRAYLDLADGALPEAHSALEEALELRRGQSDRRGFGLALAGLGQIETRVGDYESAERRLADARDIFRRAGDRWGLASALWRTADLAVATGRLTAAETALLEARAVLEATQRERWIANTVAGLADIAVLQGDERRAMTLLLEARDRYAARGDALGVQDTEERLGTLTPGC